MNSFKSGHWVKRIGYESFEPALINRPWRFDEPRIIEALSRADRQLGRLFLFDPYLNLFKHPS